MKDYLICIDSDGCAIDSMECKHRLCFGPCLVDTWQLDPWREELLERWNQINLYSMTRGINRFLGLEMLLTEVDASRRKIDGLTEYSAWCRETGTFSNDAVREQIERNRHPIFAQVLDWSRRVNQRITEISPEIRPFAGVGEILEQMHSRAEIAIVSSANPQAVREEWTRFGFMDSVDHVMAQDAGTKADCIRARMAAGYDGAHTLMVGDAPGDARAAAENGAFFYPILAGHEEASWRRLREEALPRLFSGGYGEAYQAALLESFYKNLGGN
ncbi:MAG: HAD family hydrolase [Oscillospiraceae bacterium]